MDGYSVKIVACNKELSAKERIALKDTSDAIALDTAVQPNESIIVKPDIFAVLEIHNEKSENKDYTVMVLQDENGQKYTTSSESFREQFSNINDEMSDEDSEDWSIKIYKKESKNYKGKYFITCAIV